jgi:hypothetical protein
MRVCGLEFTQSTLHNITQTVSKNPDISRRSLARSVCESKQWRSYSGRLKEAACRKALMVLNKEGVIHLPPSNEIRHAPAAPPDRKRFQPIPPQDVTVTCGLAELGPIEIKMIKSRYSKDAKAWKALMDKHHYLGAGPLCGAQLRYLITSPIHGFLGGLSFSSASFSLRERDKFIGWAEDARRANLHRVVCNSRFLIAPNIQVPNLASHTLSQCAARIASDWKNLYGVEPALLETFVDSERFSGASYRAANWLFTGKTSGRRSKSYRNWSKDNAGAKDIYLYPLRPDWRKILCEAPHVGLGQRARPEDPADWVEDEMGTVEFYDPRLTRRLFTLVRDFSGHLEAPIPQACHSEAKTKAAYRFFSNERVKMDTMLRAHTESTIERVKNCALALAVQDTTTVNYTTHLATEGLGPLNTKEDKSVGLIVHDTMAFTPQGTPLGLLDVQCWARDTNDRGKRERRKQLSIEQKESMKWLRSYRAVAEVQRLCPETTLVVVGDRESDIYDLFWEAAQEPAGPHLLVRCDRGRNRIIINAQTQERSLWDQMASLPVKGIHGVRIPRKGNQSARDARLDIRYARITLKPPTQSAYQPINVWMVYAKEINAPSSVKQPLEWMLLTTVEVNTFEQACERLSWYAKRWGIEVYHRTLKSGCRIEDRRLETAESLKACLAIDMILAWRIYHITKLSREIPNAPCTAFFEEAEWKALYIFVNNGAWPSKEPTLREATRMAASLGGFLGRKGDKEPGTTSLWRGMQRLEDITNTFRLLLPRLRAGP